jgi:splicing factor 1
MSCKQDSVAIIDNSIPRRRTRWEDGDTFRVNRKEVDLRKQKSSCSRWSIDKSFVPPPLTYIPSFLNQDQIELLLRQYRIEDISRRLTANDLEIQDYDIRSPSPEPIYDPKTGQRINTREARAKEKLLKERNTCIEECLRIDPLYKPPADYKPPIATRKLYIPQYGETPAQSYVSLILGPRGKTQKILEKKTKCKIYIRGRGASRGKNYQFDSEDEPMHVFITAESEADIERCCEILEPVLNGKLDDDENKRRRLELMQIGAENRLALSYNSEWCDFCGEQGHKRYGCPNKPLSIGWSCEICKDKNHISQDCPTRKKRKSLEEQLEEFNRETGAGIHLSQYDSMVIKTYKLHQKATKQKESKETHDPVGEEELLPPGVDY